MAGNSWSILIRGNPCTFEPDVYCPPGQPKPAALKAELGDQISWDNQTTEPHEIWGVIDSEETQLTRLIAPGKPSDAFSPQPLDPPVPSYTINYYCSQHPEETGTIEVVS